jgi:hypothetical protein
MTIPTETITKTELHTTLSASNLSAWLGALTEEQCEYFRRMPCSFNDMVRAIYEAGAKNERKVVWNEINSLIVHGELQGNGCDDMATRNGLVWACNTILKSERA